ncbi:acetyl-CoA acetyltransferase [Pseudovibrio axinellae]|uniref:Acetyl-CoA acetyltransferase n=1 Tax=Pseudovibrio axinellae TaxID=989403 RepID=A0A165ZG57_9HYPH|nr:acetyl-CoA acetyltransferase [Pseudovibrio axinellae]KZL19862.1 acetyl-CoA acetyltransferase [Pseudovibrio axinellae]SER38867.1 acetyl-CoA C-acetyltransferase [Pseudovibrio axinellae]
MSQSAVYVLGGAQTDFARNWSREGLGLEDMMRSVLIDGLEATGLEANQIEKAHLSNFTAELFCAQGQLGGLFAALAPELSGVPSTRHEAACASGSMALLSAMADIEAGRYDLICVLGLEYMRNVPGQTAAEYLGCAAYAGEEWSDATYLWPRAFSDLNEAYSEKYGHPVDYTHLGEIARINYENARRNPNAQTRKWQFNTESFTENDDTNPVIEGHVRRNDCGQVTDGAVTVFLASDRFMRAHAKKQGRTPSDYAQIEGWGHRTATMRFADKLEEGQNTRFVLPQVNQTILECFARAGIDSPFALDTIETHDCFAMTEYAAIDSFGITSPGESWKAIENGTIAFDGRLPINPSGGLIGLGHPVGATGVRMMLDSFKQVTGQAEDYQVEGAKRAGILNIGGSTTTIASFVVGRAG